MRSLPVLPLVVTVILASVTLSVSAAIEKLLVFRLLDGYTSVAGRPVSNASQAVPLKVGLSLIRLGGVDTEQQTMSAQVFLRMTWQDDALKWDPEEYEGVTRLAINRDDIWTPDIELFNAADRPTELTHTTNRVVVMSDGSAISVPFLSVVSSCPCDPDDNQVTCELRFGSWVYSQSLVALEQMEDHVETEYYQQNRDWEVLRTTASVLHKTYDCCPDEKYSTVSFKLTLKRRTKKVTEEVVSGAPRHYDVTAAILAAILGTFLL